MRPPLIKPDPKLYVDLTEGNEKNRTEFKSGTGRRELPRCWRCDRCLGEVEGETMGTLLISCRRCGAKNRISLSPPLTNALGMVASGKPAPPIDPPGQLQNYVERVRNKPP